MSVAAPATAAAAGDDSLPVPLAVMYVITSVCLLIAGFAALVGSNAASEFNLEGAANAYATATASLGVGVLALLLSLAVHAVVLVIQRR